MDASPCQRAISAIAAAAIMLLAVSALIAGLNVAVMTRGRDALVAVFVASSPSPSPEVREPAPSGEDAAKGEPAPAGRKEAAAAAVVAPRLPPLVIPLPIPVATQPASGDAIASGASAVAGSGQGVGGAGDGSGGGGNGTGSGDGVAVEPRQIRGRLSSRDLPDGMLTPGTEARVGVRYIVEVDGRVSDCRAYQPSGVPALDLLACRLIEKRYRFRPARDRDGQPVRATIVEGHNWFIRDENAPRG